MDSVSLKREICDYCHRPKPATCICLALPNVKLQLQYTYCMILQHPNESKQHQNRSLPFIEHCIDSNCYFKVIGRRFPFLSNIDCTEKNLAKNDNKTNDVQLSFVQRINLIVERQPFTILWLLSPNDTDPCSISLSQGLKEWEDHKFQYINNQSNTELPYPQIVVFVIDATWKYANEMDRSNIKHCSYPTHMKRIRLTQTDMDHPLLTQQQQQQLQPQCHDDETSKTTLRHRFAIRTPPKVKATLGAINDNQNVVYLSTAECLAYVLARIEQNDTIYHTIMKPLDLMVQQWQSYYDCSKTPL